METLKIRWTDPDSGQRLLAATLDPAASEKVQREVLESVREGFRIRYGEAAAKTVSYDDHPALLV